MEEDGKGKATEGEEISGFSSLPEGVVAKIMSLSTPPDACRLSAVSRTFVAAAQSDIVWGRFLPTDWKLLISQRKSSNLNFDPISSPKKEIFFSLCDDCPLLIDDGNKILWVRYSAADETVAIVGGECCSSRVCMDPFLDNAPPKRRRRITCLRRNPLGNSMSRAKQPQERHDGWFEIELGELRNNVGDDEVEFFLKEVNCNYSKSGLIVQGIDIRPKVSRDPA